MIYAHFPAIAVPPAPGKSSGTSVTSIVAAIISSAAALGVAIIGIWGRWYIDRRLQRESNSQNARYAGELQQLKAGQDREIEELRAALRARELRVAAEVALEQQVEEQVERSLAPLFSAVAAAASEAFEACKAVLASSRRGASLSCHAGGFTDRRLRWYVLYRLLKVFSLAQMVESRDTSRRRAAQPRSALIASISLALRYQWRIIAMSYRDVAAVDDIDALDTISVEAQLENAISAVTRSSDNEGIQVITYTELWAEAERPGSTLAATFRALDQACFGRQLQDERSPCWSAWAREALLLRRMAENLSDGAAAELSEETLTELIWSNTDDSRDDVLADLRAAAAFALNSPPQ